MLTLAVFVVAFSFTFITQSFFRVPPCRKSRRHVCPREPAFTIERRRSIRGGSHDPDKDLRRTYIGEGIPPLFLPADHNPNPNFGSCCDGQGKRTPGANDCQAACILAEISRRPLEAIAFSFARGRVAGNRSASLDRTREVPSDCGQCEMLLFAGSLIGTIPRRLWSR